MAIVEFRSGEQYVRFDGILLNPKNYKKLCGTTKKVIAVNDYLIVVGGIVYTDLKLCDIIKAIGEYVIDIDLKKSINIDLSIVEELGEFKHISWLKVDYPKLNIEKYKEINNEVDKYWKEEYNKSINNSNYFVDKYMSFNTKNK